jgi:hypothetical protein
MQTYKKRVEKGKMVLTIESVSLAGCRRIFLLSKIWEGHLRLRSLKIGKKTIGKCI